MLTDSTMGEVVLALEAVLALQESGDSLVVSGRFYNNSNSFMKSGKIILSRTLRMMGDIESLGKKKRQNKLFLPCNSPAESGNTCQDVKVADSGLKIFNLDELKKASRNFSDDMVVGEGAFGKVYIAWFEKETFFPSKPGSGIPVAVKKLNPDGYQGFEEWQMEVKLLGELSHPNVIKLLGYCSKDRDLLLVYEFMHKGSLENYILKPKGLGRTLSWSTRVKIMLGTAKGIAFLHNSENQIIIRDVKTSNILLDQDFNAKIADLGLARSGPISGETHLITQVMGTYGYAAPEYVETGYLNGKNDIYAFGVVLLETLTGLRVFDKTRAKNEQDLVQWARPILLKKKKLMTIVDPGLGDDYPQEAMYKCAKLVLKCTKTESKDRPSIEQVLQSLERISCMKKECFLMFLHSLLCISSSVGFPDSTPVDSSGSWTPKLLSIQPTFERWQEAFTGVTLVIILLNIIVYKMMKLQETSLGENNIPPSLSHEHLCRRFLLSEMQLATNSFDESMIIGKGGFGKVYRGVIDDGATMVAIKRSDSRSKQGANEFWTEIRLLSGFRHSNLVSLIGYCDEFDEMMVVYEYISGGNLAERLYKLNGSSQKCSCVSWVDRLKICIGAARALDYLHTGTGVHHRVIHRDVKSSNILLDENNTAKVSDFGVSKVSTMDQESTHVSTDVKGSFGYFDPSYFLTRRLTRKSDVYSFGVVLLEVLCGRPSVDPSLGENDLGLVGWAQQFIEEGTSNRIIDPSLMGLTPSSRVKAQIMPNCLKAFLELADKCLQTRPKDRPTMGEVVVALEAVLALQKKGDSLVLSSHSDSNSNSSMKSGKIISLSRTLRNMLLAKRPVMGDVELQDGKKRQNKWFLRGSFSNKQASQTESGDTFQEVKVADSGLKIFNLDGLRKATRNFSDDMVVGEGAFGKVYIGWLQQETYAPSKLGSGIPVAVKKHNTDGYQGFEEWKAEVELLGKLSHPNVVKLLGYCSEDRDLLLVYEFILKGTLENFVLKQGVGRTLSWSIRVKIMIGTAKGIAFLHNKENQIIFRDLKTSNILLDEEFNAKISDLGLARHGPINGETHVITEVMGTYGYAAPEYVATGYLNGKNDIYALGVVLLEILTGLRVFDKTRPENEQDLVQWARPMLPKRKKLMSYSRPES
ncbi:hypothetical protein SSX86_008008 [Deinandra increscens subsp. villosa]|uniref:non-specific serine/threonine protein kinase n=1 Tax=Deinandra increscens subsp. villosa TaxID=3103831 RepID=A0AAP0H6E9_9ASTR